MGWLALRREIIAICEANPRPEPEWLDHVHECSWIVEWWNDSVCKSIDDVLRHFAVGRHGLEDGEARRRLERHGANTLAPPKPVSALRILGAQFKSVVVYLLLAAAGVSLAMGDRIESIAIAAVLASFRTRRAR